MKNIIAAVDLTDISTRVLESAASLARLTNAKLWVLHVAAPEPDFVGYEVGPQYVRNVRANELREEHRRIQAWATEYAAQGIDSEAILITGYTAESLLDEVVKLNADLLVMGSRGHGILYDVVVGSVAAEVMRKSTTPLLLIPAPQA